MLNKTSYALKISRNMRITQSYTSNIIFKLIELGLVEKKECAKHEQRKYVTLTDKGKKIAIKLKRIKELMEEL